MQHKRSLTGKGGRKFVGVWISAVLKRQIDMAVAKRGNTIQDLVERAVRREIGGAAERE